MYTYMPVSCLYIYTHYRTECCNAGCCPSDVTLLWTSHKFFRTVPSGASRLQLRPPQFYPDQGFALAALAGCQVIDLKCRPHLGLFKLATLHSMARRLGIYTPPNVILMWEQIRTTIPSCKTTEVPATGTPTGRITDERLTQSRLPTPCRPPPVANRVQKELFPLSEPRTSRRASSYCGGRVSIFVFRSEGLV